MTWRILVPHDGSGIADSAMPWAQRLASTLRGRLTLLRVLPAKGGHLPEGGLDPELERVRASLAALAAGFSKCKPIEFEVVRGTPAEVIARLALAHDLVLMVSEPRWGTTTTITGGVTAAVIRDSGVPVLVIPSRLVNRSPRMPRQILVPLDGSEPSATILSPVSDLAQRLHSGVILFSAVPPGRSGKRLDEVARYLRGLGGELRRRQVASRTVTRLGQPGPAIVAFAWEAQVDLIAMATGAAQYADVLRLGSVTEFVFTHAPMLLLAMHPRPAEPSRGLAADLVRMSPSQAHEPMMGHAPPLASPGRRTTS